MDAAQQRVLLKLGARQFIGSFSKGHLFMRPLREFATLFEGDQVRRDEYEGVGSLIQAEGGLLQVYHQGHWLPVCQVAGPMSLTPKDAWRINVFCMHFLGARESGPLIHPSNFAFGDTFALVTNHVEFLRRVQVAAQSCLDQELKYRKVSYIDETVHAGEVGPFRKRRQYEAQSEFRIALLPGTGKQYTLEISDISDIVFVGRSEDLNNRFRFFDSEIPLATQLAIARTSSIARRSTSSKMPSSRRNPSIPEPM